MKAIASSFTPYIFRTCTKPRKNLLRHSSFTYPKKYYQEASLYQFSTQFSGEKKYTKNFVTNLVENIKNEMKKNQELQENKRQLEERIRELNDSKAREKLADVSKQTAESTQLIMHKLNEFSDYVNAALVDVKNSKIGKAAIDQLQSAVENVGKAAQAAGNTKVYKQVSYFAKEIDNIADVRLYARPEELKMRTSEFSDIFEHRTIEANTSATGVELHKDSRWYAGWKSISESQYMNRLHDWKHRFDESENLLVRGFRSAFERVSHAMSSTNKLSEVLTEINKVDPTFNKLEWLRFCEVEIIPNILEAWIRMDLTVLEDWCMERAYTPLATTIKELDKIGFHTRDSRIIDVSKVDIVGGEVKDAGPVLIIQFNVFMINVVKNTEGKVVQGDQKQPVKVFHVWALCRDLENYNPATAWRVADIGYSQTNHFTY